MATTRKYGWKRPAQPPYPNTRFSLHNEVKAQAVLPSKVDLRPLDVPIYDQGELGSCTGNGWAAACEFRDKQAVPATATTPSRLFIYYNERSLEGTTGSDAGAAVADGAKVISTLGYPPESDWSYDDTGNKFAEKPPQQAYTDALPNKVTPSPQSVDNTDLNEVRTVLASGQPIVFGFEVNESFESVGSDGAYNPSGKIIGGHCVVALGYDDTSQQVLCRNSWGTDWAAKGYFAAPYSWFKGRLVSDAWTMSPKAVPTPTPSPTPTPTPNGGNLNITIPPGLITTLEQIAIAGLSAGLTYLSTSSASLGSYGPIVAAGATILLNALNNLIGKPVSKFAMKKLCKEAK